MAFQRNAFQHKAFQIQRRRKLTGTFVLYVDTDEVIA